VTVTLRLATRDDAPAIAALHADSWRTAYRGALTDEFLDGDVTRDRMKVWEQRLSSPAANQFVIVAEEDGRIIGFACAFGGKDKRLGTLLDNIHVRRNLHRQGMGKRLLSAVADWCRAEYPSEGLYLSVLEQNTQARRFYESLGATDQEGDIWLPPGGGSVAIRRYAWSRDELAADKWI
jgi:GNAT superfamily N-acetyltransferase